MPTTHTLPSSRRYAASTASMLPGPEARPRRDEASESSLKDFPIDSARCATETVELEWVPDREARVVPDVMAALCRRCPGREACLLWALTVGEPGYWAATTSADRIQMESHGCTTVDAADRLQDMARRQQLDGALHPPGEGSFWWYRRRGCHCAECRSANAVRRAGERDRARHAA